MTADEFRRIRARLKLSTREMGLALGLHGDPGCTVRRWEAGDIDVTGPAATAMLALAKGFRPPWWPREEE